MSDDVRNESKSSPLESKSRPDPVPLKRPSAYILFFKDNYKQYYRENPKATLRDVMMAMADRWRSIQDTPEAQRYKTMAQYFI